MKSRAFLIDAAGVVLVFAVLGPFVGGLAFGLIRNLADAGAGAGWTPGLALTTMFLGHLGGLLPAALTGLIGVSLSVLLKGGRVWMIATVAAGAMLSIAHLALFDTYPTSTPDVWDFVQIGFVGALSALACAVVCVRFRPRLKLRRSG